MMSALEKVELGYDLSRELLRHWEIVIALESKTITLI